MIHYFALCGKCSTPSQPEFREFEEDIHSIHCLNCDNVMIKNNIGRVSCGKVGKEVTEEDREIFLEELDER